MALPKQTKKKPIKKKLPKRSRKKSADAFDILAQLSVEGRTMPGTEGNSGGGTKVVKKGKKYPWGAGMPK